MIAWSLDRHALPLCSFTAALPCRALDREGRPAQVPPDPWFLLGNHRLTLFCHVGGEIQWLVGERSWGRLNHGAAPGSRLHRASIRHAPDLATLGSAPALALLGPEGLAADPVRCERVFGCGSARHVWREGPLQVSRVLAVPPSPTPGAGPSAALLTLTLGNTSPAPLAVAYEEALGAHYEMLSQQRRPAAARRARYETRAALAADGRYARAEFHALLDDPDLAPDPATPSRWEGFPPALFLRLHEAPEGFRAFTAPHPLGAVELGFGGEVLLPPGGSVRLRLVLGHAWNGSDEAETAALLAAFTALALPDAEDFSPAWAALLPDFAHEPDAELRRELRWHAYVLEAMATLDAATGETLIPQGTIYDYDWGMRASARDHAQHALPLCRLHPALARSALRQLAARTTAEGFVRLGQFGTGVLAEAPYFTSDQQLFVLLLAGEYLAATGDHAFLAAPAPCAGGATRNGLDFIETCFRFLRDEVGVGSHGLVRLLNSDWNDAVYYIVKEPYNRVFDSGESHLNTSLALAALPPLAAALASAAGEPALSALAPRLTRLTAAITRHCARLEDALLADLGDRAFPRRMYFAGRAYGEENLFLEPQGYHLQLPCLPPERKRALWREVEARVLAGERLGARQQEAPEFVDDAFDYGSRENGGMWWSLNGPLVLGLATFDLTAAWRLFDRLTLAHAAHSFPAFWPGQWSSSDNIESSLIPAEGLPDQSEYYHEQPVYCAHQHAWVLHCYLKLRALGPRPAGPRPAA